MERREERRKETGGARTGEGGKRRTGMGIKSAKTGEKEIGNRERGKEERKCEEKVGMIKKELKRCILI